MRRSTYSEGWTLYPGQCLSHHAQGAGAAALIVLGGSGPDLAAAALWTVLYVSYQGLTLIRKKDAAGLDVCDYMVGLGAGWTAFEFLAWLLS